VGTTVKLLQLGEGNISIHTAFSKSVKVCALTQCISFTTVKYFKASFMILPFPMYQNTGTIYNTLWVLLLYKNYTSSV